MTFAQTLLSQYAGPRGIFATRVASIYSGSGASGFTPASLPNLAAWYRLGMGITVTGAGVSQWDDQSGNARHLLQATDTNRPALQADSSILFDGADNFLKTGAFTLTQPETVYLLAKQVSFTNPDHIFDGNTANSGTLFQNVASPNVGLFAGSVAATNSGWAIGVYVACAAVFNGASSLIQIGSGTPTNGDPGAANMGGFTLGSSGSGAVEWANIQVKEVAVYSDAHDASQRALVIAYLLSLP